jgi:hypothetical protein
MKRISGGACLFVLACASSAGEPSLQPTAAPESDAAQVIAAVEEILTALRDRDTTELRRLMEPSVRFYAIDADAGEASLRVFDLEEFLRIVGASEEPLLERIWDPQVHTDGAVATLWAPYDFHIGERFSHCGHAAFQFVRRGGMWRLVSETYTVRVASCPDRQSPHRGSHAPARTRDAATYQHDPSAPGGMRERPTAR